MNPKRGTWTVRAMDCRGYDSVERGFLNFMCSTSDEVNYFSIGQDKRDRTTKDGAMIGSFEPMMVSGDEYLLDIGMRGGHSNYDRLKKE